MCQFCPSLFSILKKNKNKLNKSRGLHVITCRADNDQVWVCNGRIGIGQKLFLSLDKKKGTFWLFLYQMSVLNTII